MKTILWFFLIRGRIKKAIKKVENELTYFENGMLKSPLPADEALYNTTRIEMKREIISQLKALL